MAKETTKIKLVERDIELLSKIAQVRFSLAEQLARRYFTKTKSGKPYSLDAAGKRLTILTNAGFLERFFIYPRASTKTITGRPSAVYIFPPAAQQKTKKELEKTNRASVWNERFSDHLHTYNHSKTFSRIPAQHELAITDFFLSLEDAVNKNANLSLLFWERTSPRHPDLTERLKVEITNRTTKKKITRTYNFNPDGFFAIRSKTNTHFYFIEYDNDTARDEEYREKILAFLAYFNQNRFHKKAKIFSERYGFSITQNDAKNFRALHVTPTIKRRDHLFMLSTPFTTKRLNLFCSLPDFIINPLGKLFVRKSEFSKENYTDYKEKSKTARPSVVRKWVKETLLSQQKISFLDD